VASTDPGSGGCDVEALDDSAELVAQLKQLALDGLQAFQLGEELEGRFASEPSRVTGAKHGHRASKAGDLAGPGRSLHGGHASERAFPPLVSMSGSGGQAEHRGFSKQETGGAALAVTLGD
jgi:hypothetical protein